MMSLCSSGGEDESLLSGDFIILAATTFFIPSVLLKLFTAFWPEMGRSTTQNEMRATSLLIFEIFFLTLRDYACILQEDSQDFT